jgi:endonuclease YncB( thermonuclease family)
MALTFRHVAQALLGFGILFVGWHAWMAHERHAHPQASDGLPTAGRVIGVSDGRSLTVLDAEQHVVRIRVAGIRLSPSAERAGQSTTHSARVFLQQFAYQQEVSLSCIGREPDGRALCHVWVGHESAGRELVRRGLVRVSRGGPAGRQDPTLSYLDAHAWTLGVGLWSATQPTAAKPDRSCPTRKSCPEEPFHEPT